VLAAAPAAAGPNQHMSISTSAPTLATTIKVNNVALQVRRTGAGTPFIWGHGLLSSMETEDALGWLAWPEHPPGIELVRYDARGHGGSGASRDADSYAWPGLGADMLGLANGIGAERFIAGGASMGCATALHAALAAPARVKAMLLMLAPTLWEKRVAQRRLYQRAGKLGGVAGARLIGMLTNPDAHRLLPPWLIAQSPAMAAAIAQGMDKADPATVADVFYGASNSDLPPRATLAALAHIPALIISWADDPSHPVSTSQELHRLLPASSLFVARNVEEVRQIPGRIRDFIAAQA
jgi:3-oxoadipate enol-lactonase